MKSKTVRTRFAPSPTGHLHLGGARTALFNYLYARANKGKFVLRIEDTDQERSTADSEKLILESLSWLALDADEGPKEGGAYSPYRQSERLTHYEKYTQKLLEKKHAYPCFCSNAELQLKQEQAKVLGKAYVYDGKCRSLSQEEVEKRKKAKEKYAIRFHTEAGEIRIDDLVQGSVKFDARLIGDFIIVKSDGFPSYNYAVVIDDHEMQISHVIRGVGHLSNTPRQILLHQALDLELPAYAHISEIVGPDHKKLSKRQGALSILTFRDLGYLSQALRNYMALLGWYPRDGVEFMSKESLEQKFDVQHCSKSPAMFDFFLKEQNANKKKQTKAPIEKKQPEEKGPEKGKEQEAEQSKELSPAELQKSINKKSKLNWLNNLYLREMPLEEIWPEQLQWIQQDTELSKLLSKKDGKKLKHGFDCTRKYLYTLSESLAYLKELFREDVKIDTKEARELLSQESSRVLVADFRELILGKKPQNPDEFTEIMKAVGEKNNAKGRALFMPIRIASTGSMEGLELPVLFSILGYECAAQRISQILES